MGEETRRKYHSAGGGDCPLERRRCECARLEPYQLRAMTRIYLTTIHNHRGAKRDFKSQQYGCDYLSDRFWPVGDAELVSAEILHEIVSLIMHIHEQRSWKLAPSFAVFSLVRELLEAAWEGNEIPAKCVELLKKDEDDEEFEFNDHVERKYKILRKESESLESRYKHGFGDYKYPVDAPLRYLSR